MSRGRRRSPLARALAIEKRARATGKWPPWEEVPAAEIRSIIPALGIGWPAQVSRVWRNSVFVVLFREVETEWGPVAHLAIRTIGEDVVEWAEKQRIKDELMGPERVGVEVFPPRSDLVDEANMYHLWILPEGMALPFSIGYGQGSRSTERGKT